LNKHLPLEHLELKDDASEGQVRKQQQEIERCMAGKMEGMGTDLLLQISN